MQHYKKIHFIGIGGIGISALAYLCLIEEKRVTGSDTTDSALLNDLRHHGALIHLGHEAAHITDDTELAIYTEAIDPEHNPEYQKAQQMGIPVLSYFEALGQLSRTKRTLAVIGTHGKTTTTAMLGLALIKSGLEPTVIVGSKVQAFDQRNIYIGKGDVFVVEACEYRRSFLNLDPFGVVLLNCEAEHLDYYKNEKDYVNAYIELVKKIPPNGFLVANKEEANVRHVASHCPGQVILVGMEEMGALDLKLQVLGQFNLFNATHAYYAAQAIGADLVTVRQALKDFKGTWRRMELKGFLNKAPLIDDYGHHPTEILATLKAIKDHYPKKRLICVFQPHQYSRTHLLLEAFKVAFQSADKVIITDIYAARDTEEDKTKINAEALVKAIRHPDVVWGKRLDDTADLLKREVSANDVVVIMGAGSIGGLAERLPLTNA